MGRVDVALEEYRALRAEILAHVQAQSTIVSVALTATAAIAAVAFGAKSGDPQRLEILLALPLVLGGLGLSYLTHSYGSVRIGNYIRRTLWPALQYAPADSAQEETIELSSWEDHVPRGLGKALLPPGGWLTFLPGLIIFGAPSAAALIINAKYSWFPGQGHAEGLEVAWFCDLLVGGLAGILLLSAGINPDSSFPDRRRPSDPIAHVVVHEEGRDEEAGTEHGVG